MEIVQLVGNQEMHLERTPQHDLLRIFSADHQVSLIIQITPSGPVLCLQGSGLTIRAEGDLAIEADKISLHGRQSVAITTGGDATIDAQGDLLTRARSQNLVATLGNANIKANDDIRLNGERVLVNC